MCRRPIPGACNDFIDRSGHTVKAVITWQEDHEWKYAINQTGGSTQQVELRAAVLALTIFTQKAVNMISDSECVVNVIT